MRLLGYALVVLVCSSAIALAGPKKGAKQPPPPPAQKQAGPNAPTAFDPKVQAEIDKLVDEYGAYNRKQAYVLALKVAQKLYDIQVKTSGVDSPLAKLRKEILAGAYRVAFDYPNAEKLYLEILHDTEKDKGPDSVQVRDVLGSIKQIYDSQQRFQDGEKIMLRILAITKKSDGENSTVFAGKLVDYGMLLFARNEFAASLRQFEASLQVHEAIAKSKTDSSLMAPLQLVGSMYWQANQPAKAIPYFDRAIKIAENATDVMFIQRTSVVWGAALQYHFGGRKDLSVPLTKKAIAMMQGEIARLEQSAPDDFMLSALRGQLGLMYQYSGDLVKAEAMYTRVVADAEKTHMTSGYEMMLADLDRLQGKNKEALALYDKLSAGMAKVAPAAGAAYDFQKGEILKEMGDYKRALDMYEHHRDRMAKLVGKKSPAYGFAQLAIAHTLALSGKPKEAEQAYEVALELSEKELQLALRSGSDADHAVYFNKNKYVLDYVLDFNVRRAPTSGNAARFALTTLLRRKGRILDAAAAVMSTIRSKLSPDDQKLLDELSSVRAQLANLMVAGVSATAGDDDAFAKEVAALEGKIQRLEESVAKKSAAYHAVTQPIELAAIQKLIPKDARLVELVNYQPFDLKMPYAKVMALQAAPPRRYLAYVAATKGDPVVVDLGEAAPIDDAIEKFRKALADPDNDTVTDLGKGLYDLTLGKVIPKLGGSTHVLIAPDGALNVVPFSALVDEKKQFLIKKYTFTYLTSGRDLLRLSIKTKAQGGGVLFADPKFDATGTGAADPNAKTRGRRSSDLASLQWPQLPGTAAEADAVSKTFKGLTVYRGEDATEGTLKAVHGPKVLHLATHGFFLPDEKPPDDAMAGAPAAMGPGGAPMPSGPAEAKTENPLLRSGLAFAGANKLRSGNEDGLLTALEASGLDLWGTQLVVLSACETGVGKVTNGDGVYGLRRSLVIAGAESLVMSMWEVDDFATKELMTGFYKNLAAGKPRTDSLRDIQLELLAKKKYAHPFYWAAFLPAGATTPLKD